MKKILRKLKKGLGKAAKVAIPVGAAFLAAKAFKNRGTDTGLTDGKFLASGAAGGASLAKQDRMAKAIKAMTSNDAYSDDTMPGNLYRDMGIKRTLFMPGIVDYMAKGGRAGHKSGGKVKGCGIAKRGLGRAMKKGKR